MNQKNKKSVIVYIHSLTHFQILLLHQVTNSSLTFHICPLTFLEDLCCKWTFKHHNKSQLHCEIKRDLLFTLLHIWTTNGPQCKFDKPIDTCQLGFFHKLQNLGHDQNGSSHRLQPFFEVPETNNHTQV